MRSRLIPLLLLCSALFSHVALADSHLKQLPTCRINQIRHLSFQSPTSSDVLEVSVGDGPCYTATVTLVVRSEYGEILYYYVAPLKRLIRIDWDDDLDDTAREFVDDIMRKAIRSTSDLPQYLPPNDYYNKYDGEVKVPKTVYEHLRQGNQAMLFHPTYYDGWRDVIYDAKTKQTVIVVDGEK
jgi:hypothetical protein